MYNMTVSTSILFKKMTAVVLNNLIRDAGVVFLCFKEPEFWLNSEIGMIDKFFNFMLKICQNGIWIHNSVTMDIYLPAGIVTAYAASQSIV